ncbi:MAG: type II secretion system protein [bacterium]|nr:type II secretion system protein [bacterium]
MKPITESTQRIRRRNTAGFSLLEAIVAILLIGIAILMATSILNATVSSARRLQTHTELLRYCEATLEAVRSGAVPLQSGTTTLGPVSIGTSTTDLRVSLKAEETATLSLFEVTVQVSCKVRNQPMWYSLTTLVWRPHW